MWQVADLLYLRNQSRIVQNETEKQPNPYFVSTNLTCNLLLNDSVIDAKASSLVDPLYEEKKLRNLLSIIQFIHEENFTM